MVKGESSIPKISILEQSPIQKIELEPKDVCAFDKCIKAINDADIIILGPGSLYTSIIPNLLVEGIAFAISASRAKKVHKSRH